MNIDELPYNQDWIRTMFWDLPAWKSKELIAFFPNLDEFRNLPVYKSAVEKGLIVNDKWKGPKEGYCRIKKYENTF